MRDKKVEKKTAAKHKHINNLDPISGAIDNDDSSEPDLIDYFDVTYDAKSKIVPEFSLVVDGTIKKCIKLLRNMCVDSTSTLIDNNLAVLLITNRSKRSTVAGAKPDINNGLSEVRRLLEIIISNLSSMIDTNSGITKTAVSRREIIRYNRKKFKY